MAVQIKPKNIFGTLEFLKDVVDKRDIAKLCRFDLPPLKAQVVKDTFERPNINRNLNKFSPKYR